MAGGMNQRDRGPSITERSARMQTAPSETCPARHCWVADAADQQGVKRPGLLIQWRQAPAPVGWEGRVVYAAQLRHGQWALVEEWLPAVLLTPL